MWPPGWHSPECGGQAPGRADSFLHQETAFGFHSNQFGFNVSAVLGQAVVIEASVDLANWVPIQTNVLTNSTFYFKDPAIVPSAQRFYRLQLQSFSSIKVVSEVLTVRVMAELKASGGKRILVVEDDPGARESIKLLLTIDRHHIVEATGGVSAFELLKTQPFDLVILDYFMPGMRGNEVALRMREIAPSVPILMITAYLEKLGDVDKPVDAILGKPFAITELRRAMVTLLS